MSVLRGLLLLSGGIDSPVAGHLVQRRGAALDAIHFSLEPFTDGAPLDKCRALCRVLGIRRLHVVDSGGCFSAIARRAGQRYYFVLGKIFMIRTAEAFARKEGVSFLVTGENLGQVSSQTLPHLAAIAAQAAIPVLRPLLGFDKSETVRIARSIGTLDISSGPEVCDVLGPKHPAVEAPRERIEREMEKAGMGELVAQALEAIRVETAEHPLAEPEPAHP